MQTSARNGTSPYKIALALIFAAFLIGMAATLTISANRGTRVVDSDYYNNGLHYDQTPSGAKNPGLGWSMSASLADNGLRVLVNDENGAPIGGGKLSFHPKRGGADEAGTLPLTESAPGVFSAPRPASPQGELHGTLRFTKGEASASQKVVLFN